MRRRSSPACFSSALAASALVASVTAPPAAMAAPGAAVPLALPSACATDDGHDFPVTARITGAPDAYVAGGDPATWYLDLTNTTSRTCAGIHPVVVLVDDEESLALDGLRMEFSDGTRTHPVSFEETELHELVGVMADDEARFPGFTVGAGRTVRVAVDLAFADGTPNHQVVADAAVVQRREGDGEWVGQSGNYRFQVIGDQEEDGGGDEGGDTADGAVGGVSGGTDGGAGARREGAGDAGGAGQLARTGAVPAPRTVRLAATGSVVCLLLGTLLLLLAHRVRRVRKAPYAP